ncbi:MAG: hypothetical protein WCC81_09725, partial [Pseudolabrys sp.]
REDDKANVEQRHTRPLFWGDRNGSNGSWKGPADCPLWVKSGHVQRTRRCPLCANSGHQNGGKSAVSFSLAYKLNQAEWQFISNRRRAF